MRSLHLKSIKKYLPLSVFALFIGFFLGLSPAAIKNGNNNLVITLGDNGFSKSFATIKQGDTITWVISGKNLHWPASDPHPNHTDYPEKGGCIGSKLDACKPLKVNEKYSFTFNDPGEWGVHDHLSPGHQMIIKVASIQSVSAAGLGNNSYIEQAKKTYDLADSDPHQAWLYLKKTFIINGQSRPEAHELAHYIGNKLYDKFGFEGINKCDDSFGFGCYHGISERMLFVLGKKGADKIESKCVDVFGDNHPQKIFSCIHGAGHGILTWNHLNIQKALSTCDTFSPKYIQYCYGGTFMEFAQSAPLNSFSQDNPWSFCYNLDNKYQSMCAKNLVDIYSRRINWNLEKLDAMCSIADSPELLEKCYYGLGIYIARISDEREDKITENCRKILDEKNHFFCIMYASEQVVFYSNSDWQKVTYDLCNNLTAEYKERCLARLQDAVRIYKKS